MATNGNAMTIIPDESITESKIVSPKTGQTIDGKFPSYKNVMPLDYNEKVKANVQGFLNAFKGVKNATKSFIDHINARINFGENGETNFNPRDII